MLCLLFVCGVLAGASGIGGGGLNVPILMLTSDFLVEEAVPLSHVMVLGNAIAQNLVNSRRHHPHSASRPMIDLDVPLLLLPAQLVGNAVGVLVAPILPPTGVETLAMTLLFYAATKTVFVALKNFRKERKLAAAKPLEDHTEQLLTRITDTDDEAAAAPAADDDGTAAAAAAAAVAQQQQQQRRGNVQRLLALFAIWLLFLANFVGEHVSGAKGCAPARFAFLFVQLLIPLAAIGGFIASSRRGATPTTPRPADATALPSRLSARPPAARVSLPGDVRWTSRSVGLLPLLAAAIGLVAGLLGLGGGELMAPLLLALGMLPQVASATSACMVFFTASSNIVHYLVEGVLSPDPEYVGVLLGLGFVSALVGRLVAITLVSRLAHPSLLAFLLAATLYVGLALLAVQISSHPIDWSVGNLCG